MPESSRCGGQGVTLYPPAVSTPPSVARVPAPPEGIEEFCAIDPGKSKSVEPGMTTETKAMANTHPLAVDDSTVITDWGGFRSAHPSRTNTGNVSMGQVAGTVTSRPSASSGGENDNWRDPGYGVI